MTNPTAPVALSDEEFTIAKMAASTASDVARALAIDDGEPTPSAAAKAVVDAFLAASAQLIAARP